MPLGIVYRGNLISLSVVHVPTSTCTAFVKLVYITPLHPLSVLILVFVHISSQTYPSSSRSPSTTMSKEDYTAEKGYEVDDIKHDVERSSINLQEEENSPIPEVAATVSTHDDPSLPALTFRYWVMGVVFSVLLAFFNQFL